MEQWVVSVSFPFLAKKPFIFQGEDREGGVETRTNVGAKVFTLQDLDGGIIIDLANDLSDAAVDEMTVLLDGGGLH
jgi:hypothetical protein